MKEHLTQQISRLSFLRLTTIYSVHQKHAESLLLIALWPCRQIMLVATTPDTAKAVVQHSRSDALSAVYRASAHMGCMHALVRIHTSCEMCSSLDEQQEMCAGQQGTSSKVSNLQLLPSSVTSFHHLSPTKSLPATFLVCIRRCLRA